MIERANHFRRAVDRALARSSARIEQSNALLRAGQIEGSEFLRARSDQLMVEAEEWSDRAFLLSQRAAELEADSFRLHALFGAVASYPEQRGVA